MPQPTIAAPIDEVVRQVMVTHPRLQALGDNRTAVDEELRRARGLFLPQLDFEGGGGAANRRADDARDGWGGRGFYSVIASQRLFDGFEAINETERQKARAASAAARVFESAEVLGLDAIAVYVNVWRQRELLDLARGNVATHEDMLGSLRQRQQRGGGSAADVAQTEARLARARDTLLQVENDLRNAEALYERIVGQAPGNVVLPAAAAPAALPTSLAEGLQRAEREHPAVRIFAADTTVAEREVGLTERTFMPAVNLELGHTYDYGRLGTRDEREEFAIVRARWNLYRGGSDVAQRRAALARQSEARNNLLDAQRIANEEMRQSWHALQISQERQRALREAVDFSELTRDNYRQQFTVAQRTLLDVLDAENELFVASGQHRTAVANEVVASYRVLAVLGNLLSTMGVEPPPAANPAVRSFGEDLFR